MSRNISYLIKLAVPQRLWVQVLSCFFFFLPFSTTVFGQNANLANQYFTNGEYEKAALMYEGLLDQNGRNDQYLDRYVTSLINLEAYERCESQIKSMLKKAPDDVNLYVAYGTLYDRLGKPEKAAAQFQKAIDVMAPDYNMVNLLANKFMSLTKYDYAIKTYEVGTKAFKDPNRFAYNLGELYRRKGENPKMIEYYLRTLDAEPNRLSFIQSMLARFLPTEEYAELQTQLYARLQADANNPTYIELLAWSFIQKKDYKSALRQLRALDKRLGENGNRVYRMAKDAANDRDFDAALEAYDYILTEKGETNTFYFQAKRESMDTRRRKVTEGFSYTMEDLRVLEADYEKFLLDYGQSKQTATIVLQLAELEALYINDLEKAIGLLEALIEFPGLDRDTKAEGKIKLADYYLIKGERWESTLLYSQVDKEFKEEQLGQEARFKNAKLSYFNSDFQWAQAQFDVLKASTSKLIANDALDLSVFIMDNLNLDTTAEALSLYAEAEMLVYQNRFDDAFVKLAELRENFPKHSLQDDLYYLEAQIWEKRQNWEKAITLYQKVAKDFKTDIRADNALYAMARLYETRLNNPEKAKEIYEHIFLDYSGSVFAVDARKRYRILRGDKLQ